MKRCFARAGVVVGMVLCAALSAGAEVVDSAGFQQIEEADGYWRGALGRAREISRVELTADVAAEMGGQTLRVFNLDDQTVFTAAVTSPDSNGVWAVDLPAGTFGRVIRYGLENGATNAAGNDRSSLAEIALTCEDDLFASTSLSNVALGAESYMVRLSDGVLDPANANDGDLATEVVTTYRTVDGYWEVDLGDTYAVYGVESFAATSVVDPSGVASYPPGDRNTNTTLRLYDAFHDSVHSEPVSGSLVYTNDVGGPRPARFVRFGLENKVRTSTDGSTQWYIGFKEVRVYARPLDEVGLLSFGASAGAVSAGAAVTLNWEVEGVHRVELYPAVGSVGADTDSNGVGSLVVNPTETTEYTLVASGPGFTNVLSTTVVVDGVAPTPFISEFVAENNYSLEDGYGDAPDWIEIQNPASTPLDLTGYGLSDNPAKPLKWTFPAVTVPAHGRLIVFASGSDEAFDPAGGLHADFKLENSGESIVLTAPNGTDTLDAILDYPAQEQDLAYGRDMEGNLTFIEPTPRAANLAETYLGWLYPLSYSHKRGFYDAPFDLSFSNKNIGATALYSLDGSEPSIPLTNSLPISATTVVRTQVERAGYKAPQSKTHTYLFLDDVVASTPWKNSSIASAYPTRLRDGLTDLPTISLTVPGGDPQYTEAAASVEVIWPDENENVQENCGVKRFGGAWTVFDKINFRVKFRAEYGKSKMSAPLFNGHDHGLLAKTSFDELELVGGGHDMSLRGFYMAGRFVEDAMLDMGQPNPHGRYAHLYLNGVYWGQFHLRERLVENFMADYLGGSDDDYVAVRGNDNIGANFVLGDPAPPNRAGWDYVRAHLNDYENIQTYLDVENYIDFMLLWFYGFCETEYRACGPIAPGSGFKFWIADADGFFRESKFGSDTTYNVGPGYIFGGLTSEAHPDFMMLLADRIYKHFFHDGALSPDVNAERLTERMDEIVDSKVAECARWDYQTPDSWLDDADAVYSELFPVRSEEVVGFLRDRGFYPSIDPPEFDQRGGAVEYGFEPDLTVASGTIYYTLDGSDPRLPGGAVSPGAVEFSTTVSADGTLVPKNALWKYHFDGTDQGTAWRSSLFDDSAWGSGYAELGYGLNSESTTLSSGRDDRHNTAYFRRSFNVADASIFSGLELSVLRDDGIVVYLNGTELLRNNMPTGTISYNTTASSSVGDAAAATFYTFTLPTSLLVDGSNVLAVEVHQGPDRRDDRDLAFNLEMKATGAGSVTLGTPIVISDDTTVRARNYSGGEWSALNEADFWLGDRVPAAAGDLLISEINYNPDGADDYEFIELWNRGTNLLDLSDMLVEDGVRFVFPAETILAPGAFVVVVEDAAAFAERYQDPASPWYWEGVHVAGEWVGGLSDGGEALTLYAADGSVISSVSYRSDGDWPERPDGGGASLELVAPESVPAELTAQTAYLSDGRNWGASSLYHGSPGRFESAGAEVVINELLAHTDVDVDWIELYNPGVDYVDLSGMALTDTLDLPARYVFPAGTSIDAGGYLTVSASDLGFGYSELGSKAALLELSDGDIVRVVDQVDFPAVEREEPFGRYTRSDGEVDFTELSAITPGAANAAPRVGPVVISEIMFTPAAGYSEFVEILNISGAEVALFDEAIPTNTWAFSGVGDFAFPEGVTLAANETAILCATNPAAFRVQHGLNDSVQVFGPWLGGLAAEGEKLRLLAPGDPEPDGTVPFYRVDRVSYRVNDVWPATSAGVSLERRQGASYGNDPANWKASAAGGSPGAFSASALYARSGLSFAAGSTPIISFTSADGESYEIQYTESLTDADWQTLAEFTDVEANEIEVTDPSESPSNRFYRVVLPSP